MQFKLGDFTFDCRNFPVSEFGEKINSGWSSEDRINNTPKPVKNSAAWTEISMSGEFLLQNNSTPAVLLNMAKSYASYKLVSGAGDVYGKFKITEISFQNSRLTNIGQPRVKSFTLNLKQA